MATSRLITWDRNGNKLSDILVPLADEIANQDVLRQRALNAITVNQTFMALATPTNAQVLAQVQALTKECTALIRVFLAMTADISDT